MKTVLVFLFLSILIGYKNLHAQGVGINNTAAGPDASAMLDVASTTKGLLPPRMTLAQRDLIALPANGLIIYQTDAVAGLYVNKGSSTSANWVLIGPATTVASPAFVFNTDQSVGNNIYIGSGASGSSFIRYTSAVPADCILKSITFSTRDFFVFASFNTTATVWRQSPGPAAPEQTTLSATISNGYLSISSGSVAVTAGDLISVRITSTGGPVLTSGVAVTVTYQ